MNARKAKANKRWTARKRWRAEGVPEAEIDRRLAQMKARHELELSLKEEMDRKPAPPKKKASDF